MTAAHLDHDSLADLAEGLLDEKQTVSAEEHLADCAHCRARAVEVAEVSRVLADAPTPPMPAHLVDRLDSAIAAEAAARSGPRRGHAQGFRLLTAAAAAVVVIGAGAVLGQRVLNEGSSQDLGASQPAPQDNGRGTPRHGGVQAAPLRDVTVVDSGTHYTSQRLPGQVNAVVTHQKARPGSLGKGRVAPGCVARVTDGRRPILVDAATYDGTPATVIVLPGATSAKFDVWVAGPECSADTPDTVAHVQVPRTR